MFHDYPQDLESIIYQIQLEHTERLDEPRSTPKPRKRRERRKPDISILLDAVQQKQIKSKP